MNKYITLLALVACTYCANANAVQAATVQTDAHLTQSMDNLVGNSYTVEILTLDSKGNRSYFSGQYKNLTQAHMAYQGYLFELPEDATLIYARIIDGNGRVIQSLGN